MDDIYSKCAKYFLENQNEKIGKLIGNIASHLREQDALGLMKDLDQGPGISESTALLNELLSMKLGEIEENDEGGRKAEGSDPDPGMAQEPGEQN